MAEIIFFEKPGCINNTRQKKMLVESGHWVQAVDMLRYNWTASHLMSFFLTLPVRDWFNPSAPQVKAGVVNPHLCDKETALKLMLINPILIRRPLLQVGKKKMVGFDQQQVDKWLGLKQHCDTDIETCPVLHE